MEENEHRIEEAFHHSQIHTKRAIVSQLYISHFKLKHSYHILLISFQILIYQNHSTDLLIVPGENDLHDSSSNTTSTTSICNKSRNNMINPYWSELPWLGSESIDWLSFIPMK